MKYYFSQPSIPNPEDDPIKDLAFRLGGGDAGQAWQISQVLDTTIALLRENDARIQQADVFRIVAGDIVRFAQGQLDDITQGR